MSSMKPINLLFLYGTSDSVESIHRQLPWSLHTEWDTKVNIDLMIDSLKKVSCIANVYYVEYNLQCFDKIVELWSRGSIDLAFPYVEGTFGPGRESLIPAFLENLKIPIVGSDSVAIGLCHDKFRTRQILGATSSDVPSSCIYSDGTFLHASNATEEKLPYIDGPWVLKPVYEGSSMGLVVVNDLEQLVMKCKEMVEVYKQPVLIDEYLPGDEFTIGVVGNHPYIEYLPTAELTYNTPVRMCTEEVKFAPFGTLMNFECPVEVDSELESLMQLKCAHAIKTLGIKDWARFDIRLDKRGEPKIMEINLIPGIVPDPTFESMFPVMWWKSGRSYTDLLTTLVEVSRRRYGI